MDFESFFHDRVGAGGPSWPTDEAKLSRLTESAQCGIRDAVAQCHFFDEEEAGATFENTRVPAADQELPKFVRDHLDDYLQPALNDVASH